ncbi:MAG: hypothetical protein AAB676_16710 [Verrucomicrobiota bacterium]
MTNLTSLELQNNFITDLAPLFTNTTQNGFGAGDQVFLSGNPLSSFARTNQIPALRNTYGVAVPWP